MDSEQISHETDIVERRAARAAHYAVRRAALRASEGAVGEQLRAIAKERAFTIDRVVAFDGALKALDRVTMIVADGEPDARDAAVVDVVRGMIGEFVARFGQLVHAWPDPDVVEQLVRTLGAESFDHASARTCAERLDEIISIQRHLLADTLLRLEARERVLVERG